MQGCELWQRHSTTHVQECRVDAMTGADGCKAEAHLSEFFEFPRFLSVVRWETGLE